MVLRVQRFRHSSTTGQYPSKVSFLVWSLVAIFAVALAKRLRTSAAIAMGGISLTILAVSLVYAIYASSHAQDEAYLMTATRAWQFAFGALLALSISDLRFPKQFRATAGRIGLALIVSCGLVLDGAVLFRGPWTLWPLAGLTLVLISAGPNGGNNDPKWTATNFLSNRPLAWIGDRSYGIYL